MRKFSTAISLLLLCISSNILAVEPVIDQQVMLYYQIPFGGNNHQANKHNFGLRFDQTSHMPGDITDFSDVMKKPAMFDLQMGHKQALAFKVNGVDYTEKFSTQHAAEAESSDTEVETVTEENGGGEEEAVAEGEDEAVEEKKEEKTTVQKTIDELPFGVILGVIVFAGILGGLGG